MADIYAILADINSGLNEALKDCGFTAVIPEGVEKGELPAVTDSGRITIEYKGENKALKLEHFNNKISILGASKEGEIISSDFSQISLSLLDAETADSKDVKYIVNEFSETLVEYFGAQAKKPVKAKLPTPVSKAAAKSGSVSYDPNTLANRFTTIYTDLREEYKANCEKYGQFLPEEFFINHGTPAVLETIKENNPAKMKRLFNLLNEIYEDGTNETQSLIAVTILGAMNNDQEMLAACVDYMSDDMMSPVINVNKYLASSSGKGAKMRLANPPQYKPKKAKKKGMMSMLGNGN
ncbi:MAG: hypothetical protein IJE74_00230 [Clostridia bacterium]|nr:hypothetical protein [Clostridia bacterium]